MIKMRNTVEAMEKNNGAVFPKESKITKDVFGLTAKPTAFLQKACTSRRVVKMYVTK